MLYSQQRITSKVIDLLPRKADKRILKKYIFHPHTYWLGSGREALRQILLHISKKDIETNKLKDKKIKKVGIPAYTCRVVLDAVKRAGFTPIFYDSGVISDIEDIKKIISEVDVLLLCYNFGFLPQIEKIASLCKENRVILIEDCAQALGTIHQGKLAGSFGDYAFYSFGMSKNIGFCGGLIASHEPLQLTKLEKYPHSRLLKTMINVLISHLFFNKYLYPHTKKLLAKELHKEQPLLSYPCSPYAKKVILRQLEKYNQIKQIRERNAHYCKEQLADQIKFITGDSSELYFVFFGDETFRKTLIKAGLDAGRMLTFQCLDEKSKKAKEAEKVLTFALYRPFKEIKDIVNIIKKQATNNWPQK